MVKSEPGKEKGRVKPTELYIIVFLEAFAGVRYLIDIIAYMTFDPTTMLLIALMVISFLVAYGLWKFAKWAWVISFVLSLFGVISTASLLAINGASEDALFFAVPSIAIDILVIALLLVPEMRKLFWGGRAAKALQAPQS